MAGMTGANVLGKQDLDFHCNRPFVYVIYEASSGTVFFIGTFRG
jgi:serpin B